MHPQMSGASMIEVDDLASAPGEITAAQWASDRQRRD
jgi:hypothetical protein